MVATSILTTAEAGLGQANKLVLKNGVSAANQTADAAVKTAFRTIIAAYQVPPPVPVEPPPVVVPPVVPPPVEPPPVPTTTWGLWYDNGEGDFVWSAKEFAAAEAEFGKVPLVHFAHELKPSLSDLKLATSHGGTAFLDWGESGVVTCKGTLAGTYDADLAGINQAISELGQTVYFRPLWEMNGDWYSWGQSSEYIAAWKHIYGLMTAANVQVVWCPNYIFTSQLGTAYDPGKYWPGEAYVDYVGCDIYVKAANEPVSAVFPPIYKRLKELAPNRKIIVCEWGISTSVSNQAAEFEAFLARFHADPASAAHLYFDWNDGGVFRPNAAAIIAFNAHK